MLPGSDREDIQIILEGMCNLTHEYKRILRSNEYKKGRSLLLYTSMLKRGEILTLFKKLLSRNNAHNSILQHADYNKPQMSDYITEHKIAVYTAIFGKYDGLREPVIKPNNIDYYIITDQSVDEHSLWNPIDYKKAIPNAIKSPIERNRYAKMLPHKIFKDYDYSIYVDGNVFITSDLSVLIKTLDDFPIAMHRHKNRNCVYEEIAACISKGKDNTDRLKTHEQLLENHGVPRHGGLLEATVIARKHTDIQCIELMENWWGEFTNYSKRDQISLIDCLWVANVDVDKVARLGDNIMENDNFVIIPHLV